MMLLYKVVLLLLVLLVRPLLAQPPQRNKCKFHKNITDVQQLDHHKYIVLEECLYYFLVRQANKAYGDGNPNESGPTLILRPPVSERKNGVERMTLSIDSVELTKIKMQNMEEMRIYGSIKLSWKDSRMTWSVHEWKKIKTLRVHSSRDIWTPDIAPSVHDNHRAMENIVSTSSGELSAKINFFVTDDKRRCCTRFTSELYRDLIDYKLKSNQLGTGLLKSRWTVKQGDVQKNTDPENNNAEYVDICVSLQRKASTLRIELTTPMVTTACLVLSAPLFGPFVHQLYAKLFAILLQFICFQFVISKSPLVGFGDQVPAIHRFYEWTMVISLVSLLVTLLLSALSRLERRLPPPHRLSLIANMVNINVCCGGRDDETLPAGTSNDPSSKPEDHMTEWRQVYAAANQLFGALLAVVYIFAIIIIAL